MSYGVLITNPEGKILIDGERRMPKLHHHGRYHLSTQGASESAVIYYCDVTFTPTSNPVFVTMAIDESVHSHGKLRGPYVFRDASNRLYKARLEAYDQIYVFAWVYEI